ncbi:hypothetical protein C0992_003415 [Termitomyces sp. T32_za158]|nr:hypothetical protein C0992_003415 [Termitomyces sp. T32_za158]
MDHSSHDSFHVAQFAESLLKLQVSQAGHDNDDDAYSRHPKTPLSRDEYGFRKSGIASPQLPSDPNNPMPVDLHNIVPDPNGLGWPAKSTVSRLLATPEEKRAREEKMAAAVRVILESIGEAPDREGLLKTPERFAQALMWMTRGYEEKLAGHSIVHCQLARYSSSSSVAQMLSMMPYLPKITTRWSSFGTSTSPVYIAIAYIPNQLVLGLSKLARIAETFSRRLQVQERLTKQVAIAVQEAIKPRGVAVVMEATHMCMTMRGVQKPGSITVTSCMLGCFRTQQKTREEFLTLIKR